MIKLIRPVRWERFKDWKLTQWWWERPEFYKKIWRPYHLGLDYAWPKSGDKIPVYSCTDGKVAVWYDRDWFWNYIKIYSGEYTVYYAHLESVQVVNWQQVKAMQQIGIMGTTGNSDGVHLHLGLKWPWSKKSDLWRLNPSDYIVDRPTINQGGITTTATSTIWKPKPIASEVQLLINDGIYTGEGELTLERLLIIMARIYSKLK